MKVEEIDLKGCFLITPTVFKDNRGYFYESFNKNKFNEKLNSQVQFVQDNQSVSLRGVLRGLHYQLGEFSQAKLVRVISGKILDVIVDLRKKSKTYGAHFSIELSADNQIQLFIPRGFAHGFLVLEDNTIFSYKCDNYYKKESEAGIIYNDPDLNIDWRIPEHKIILSDKDLALPFFKNLVI